MAALISPRFGAALALSILACSGPAAQADQGQPAVGHLRLVNDLDRPQDGYCIDIMGSGNHLRFDMPMTAHNCKPGLYHDEAVTLDPAGQVRFPAYGVCATVAGLNGKVLPNTAVMPRRCDERSPFLVAGPMQRFTFHADGRVELRGTGLCLAVGDRSDSTFDETHRWRALYMADCVAVDEKLSRWRFVEHYRKK